MKHPKYSMSKDKGKLGGPFWVPEHIKRQRRYSDLYCDHCGRIEEHRTHRGAGGFITRCLECDTQHSEELDQP